MHFTAMPYHEHLGRQWRGQSSILLLFAHEHDSHNLIVGEEEFGVEFL
jgi:hypothetical protein